MGDISSDISSFSLMQTVEYFERGLIATELARHAGSLSRTAESLQVAKSTLSDKTMQVAFLVQQSHYR